MSGGQRADVHLLMQVRVGEVGGGNLGFLGGLFSPDGQAVLAHGYQGAFHLWHYDKVSEMTHSS